MNDMSFEDITNLSPLNSSKSRRPSIFIKDANLRIHAPTPKEAFDLEKTHTFKNVLSNYLTEVNTLQHDADAQIQRLVAGETENLHEVMLAMDEAQTTFSLMMEIRNSLVDSYKEITRG
jgi:flagellar hook-basal body complex protein FliE